MFGLRAKLAMAQEYHPDGTFNDARYYDVCCRHLSKHIPGVDIAGVRALRQEGLFTDYSFADALDELLGTRFECRGTRLAGTRRRHPRRMPSAGPARARPQALPRRLNAPQLRVKRIPKSHQVAKTCPMHRHSSQARNPPRVPWYPP